MSKKADKLDFFINVIESGINYELFFSIMRDYRLGGLNPTNYDKFIRRVRKFPDIDKRYFSPSQSISDFTAIIDPSARIRMKLFLMRHNLSDLNLQEVTTSEARRIWERIVEIIVDKTKFCWHPEASNSECTKDQDGNIKISRAHSIQHNKILKYISEDHQVRQLRSNEIEGKMVFPIKHASTFYGFCDKHDKLFIPIEKQDYSSTYEQNFLFAYRAHVHSAHVKLIFNEYMNFGEQVKNDIITEKKIFDHEYPIAVSSSSDLDFDYFGNSILHSDTRMEGFYLTVFPQSGKTYILFSYLALDIAIYGNIIGQIKARNNIESDLSVLIAGHCENTFYKPSYYNKYISNQEEAIDKLLTITQFDIVPYDGYGVKSKPISQTPKDYLDNKFNIQLFFKP